MRVKIGTRANRQLIEIARYIRPKDAEASIRVGRRIRESIAILSRFPRIGREGNLGGTREIVIPGLPFVVVYRIETRQVFILGVHHCARDR